jgi:hypothetical protein
MSVVPIVSLGLLLVIGLILGIPLLVILLIGPKSRAALMSAVRFIGWAVGCVFLLALLGYFVAVPVGPAQQTVTHTVHSTNLTAERASDSGLAPPAKPGIGSSRRLQAEAVDFAPQFTQVSSVRPDWVDRAPGIQDQTYCVTVKSGLWTTDGECQTAIQGAIVKSLDEYLTSYFGDDRAARLVDFDPAYLRQHLVKQPLYAETVDASVGSMRQLHALLEFDDDMRAELHRLWRQAFVSNRLRDAAAGFALVLAALGTLFAYLKLDLATGGQHRGRLRWASGLAILLVAAGAVGICVL